MKLFEYQGLIRDKIMIDGKEAVNSYKSLVQNIVDYIWDPLYGPFNLDNLFGYDDINKTKKYCKFSLSEVKSWYYIDKFNFKVPFWLEDFEIKLNISGSKLSKNLGAFYINKSAYDQQTQKLSNVYIECTDFGKNTSKESLRLVLLHEFQHAYDYYLQCRYTPNKKAYYYNSENINDIQIFNNNKINVLDYNNIDYCIETYKTIFYYASYLERKANIETFSEKIDKNSCELKDTTEYVVYSRLYEFLNNYKKIKPSVAKELINKFLDNFNQILNTKVSKYEDIQLINNNLNDNEKTSVFDYLKNIIKKFFYNNKRFERDPYSILSDLNDNLKKDIKWTLLKMGNIYILKNKKL